MTDIVPISGPKNHRGGPRNWGRRPTGLLAKNGRGKYVVQSLAEYEKLQAAVKLLAELSRGVESIRKEGGLPLDAAFAGLED